MKNIIQVNNKTHLKQLIEQEIKENGFNCSLNHLDVSSITDMSRLFKNSQFNGDISLWDTSRVNNMKAMFFLSRFTDDISKWNTSSVVNLRSLVPSTRVQTR